MTSLSLKYPAWAEEERVCGISWVGVKTGWQVNSNCPQIYEQLEVLNKLYIQMEKSSNCLLDSAHSAFQEMACVADWKKSEYFTLNLSAAGGGASELVF